MEKQKKSYGKTALIVLLLIVTIASLVLATYAWAKYTSQKEGTATAQVAKWDVDATFDHSNYQNVQSFNHVLGNRLAPGTSGQFKITIKPQDTEVDFAYEIILEKVTAEEGGQVPAHLHFYTSETHDENNLIGGIDGITDIKENTGDSVENMLTGKIEGAEKKDKEVTIYWDWPYENPNTQDKADDNQDGITNYDEQDTQDGQKASKITVTYKVIMTQIKPEA